MLTDHIREFVGSSDLKLRDAGKSFVRQPARHLCLKSPVVGNPACSEVSRSSMLQNWRFNASVGRDVQWFLSV